MKILNKSFLSFFLLFIINFEINANTKLININNLVNDSSKNNRQVLIFFHMKHCGYCERMKNRTLKDLDVLKTIKNSFTFVDINIDDKKQILLDNRYYSKKEFATFLDVDFFPTIVFLDNEYEITYTVRGHRTTKEFKQILEFVKTKSYENIDFFDYKNKEIEKE